MEKQLIKAVWSSFRNNLSIGVFCAGAFVASAQNTPVNLAPNGDFEEHTSCPNSLAGIGLCDDWQPLVGSPDYYHICGSGWGSAPHNINGYQLPGSDSAYLGLASYTTIFPGGQEVAYAPLQEPLIQGVKYRVSFKVSYADSANYAICCIGAILSSTPPPQGPYSQNLSSVELILDENDFDMNTWFEYEGVYTAQGGEDKIYLGSFRPESEMNVMTVRPPGEPYDNAYFYIDDVSVVEDTVTGIGEVKRAEKLTGENGRVSVGNDSLLIELLDVSGRKLSEGLGSLDVSGLSGLYIIQVSENGVPVHTEKMVFLK